MMTPILREASRAPEWQARVLLVTDDPASRFARSVHALYPGGVRIAAPGDAWDGAGVPYLVAVLGRTASRAALDFGRVEEFARRGGTAVVGLDEYAGARGLLVRLARMPYRALEDPLAEGLQPAPEIEIVKETDVTRGFPAGSLVPGFGIEGEDVTFERPAPEGDVYVQRQLAGVRETEAVAVLALDGQRRSGLRRRAHRRRAHRRHGPAESERAVLCLRDLPRMEGARRD